MTDSAADGDNDCQSTPSCREPMLPRILCLTLCLALTGLVQAAPPPHGGYGPQPPYYQREHPQHRLAWWYASESTRQAEEARRMVCGFTGSRWTLDWEVHYRWALRAAPQRVYKEIEERDRHLTRCRRSKLNQYRRSYPEYRRTPPDGR